MKYGEGSPLYNFFLHILFLNKTLLKLQIIQFILLYHIYKKKKQA